MRTREEILKKYGNWAEKLITDEFYQKLNEIMSELSEEAEDKVIFIHFLANLLPITLVTTLTDKQFKDVLEFNHFANKVIFEEQNL